MLSALSIRDFVLIDQLDLAPGDGFTALTGETGAGKSILLDAIGLALGGAADRALIRSGCQECCVVLAFALSADHPVWAELESTGIQGTADEVLTLKRVVRQTGPSRAFVNDQPASAALLSHLAESLIDIRGQHAATGLLRPSRHMALLDEFGGTCDLLNACREAWTELVRTRERLADLETRESEVESMRDDLTVAVQRLAALSPQPDEADRLAALRLQLMQAERVVQGFGDVAACLEDGGVAEKAGAAARRLTGLTSLPGFDEATTGPGAVLAAAAAGLERATIEIQECESAIAGLMETVDVSPEALDAAETRLFALRAEARRHQVDIAELPTVQARLEADLAGLENIAAETAQARSAVREGQALWHHAADQLSRARHAAARRLEAAVSKELPPLKLERTRFQIAITDLPENETGARGRDRIRFEVETNPGMGFQPLDKIASGGELARLSLALTCALAGCGTTTCLVFDEADQGVGGAVAAAIGERLARLGSHQQVFTVTHSPQVAAAADHQWAISKQIRSKGLGRTHVNGLDVSARREEIARMLAGAAVTEEARAAAGKLLEMKCQQRSRLNA